MPLTKDQKDIITAFQTEHTRLIEEQFAQILTERSDIRVFFINENRCFTDGKNITIDPGERDLFVDRKALCDAEQFLHLDNSISNDPWLALQMQTRASNIHESLHIMYSSFPPGIKNDKRATNQIRTLVLADIHNVIEDAFIEAVGCSQYDNLEHYLLWNRIALFFSNADIKDTLEWRFEESGIQLDTQTAIATLNNSDTLNSNDTFKEKEDAIKYACLMVYLQYMGLRVLYPFYQTEEPPKQIREYIEKTENWYLQAAVCGSPDKRYEYVQNIFDVIEPLIPDNPNMPMHPGVNALLSGARTHSAENMSFDNYANTGREAAVTRRLFTDENETPVSAENIKEKIEQDIKTFLLHKADSLALQKNEAFTVVYRYSDFDCSNVHSAITLEVHKPKINKNLKKAYQNKVLKYQLSIHSYSTRIGQYLKSSIDEREEKKLFGSGISSKHLGDTKKRYWYRNGTSQGIPDIGFLFLVDGSGSMRGERIANVMDAMIIIHEVFNAHTIQHSIIEHRAIYEEPKVVHNILVDFNYRDEEKYNILSLDADEGTREGFSLYWAEKHLHTKCTAEYKTLIVISDGAPEHSCEEESTDYVPPVSIQDTAAVAKKIIRRGTPIIALALDNPGETECYEQLKQIYQDVVACVDTSNITGQLLTILAKVFQGRIQ